MHHIVVTSIIIVDVAVENSYVDVDVDVDFDDDVDVDFDVGDDDDFLGGSHQSNFSPHCPISCE